MGVNLVAGFQANIQIKDRESTLLYQKRCSSIEEVKDFIQQHGKSKEGWSLIQGTVIPLRTQNLKDFSKDFFLPTFVNFSLKINNIALKIIASIFAIALDIIMAPIRLFTTPVRIYDNYKHPEVEHSIISLIEKNPGSQKAIDDNFVNLCYKVQNVQMSNPSVPDEEGNTFQRAAKSVVKGTLQIALRRMPGGIKGQSSEEKESSTYLGMNGKWIGNNFSNSSSSHYNHAF
jgi:hypothetical protein